MAGTQGTHRCAEVDRANQRVSERFGVRELSQEGAVRLCDIFPPITRQSHGAGTSGGAGRPRAGRRPGAGPSDSSRLAREGTGRAGSAELIRRRTPLTALLRSANVTC